jgi:hypothetical protein
VAAHVREITGRSDYSRRDSVRACGKKIVDHQIVNARVRKGFEHERSLFLSRGWKLDSLQMNIL